MSDGLVQLRPSAASASANAARATATATATAAPRVYVETYGCQMNVADSNLILGLFTGDGYARTDRPEDADLILLNTCAVREKAEERVFIRALELAAHKAARPGTVLGITGCMAEHLKERVLERAPHVDLVAGPDSYRRLGELVARARSGAPHDALIDVRLDRDETYEGLDGVPGGDGVSGFVTVQRGCDKFCTFCVVPLTRGRERATPPREVLRLVRALVAGGVREVTLLGQTVNSYRHEEARFSDLLRAVAQVPGLERVRFTSPYPIDFTADLIDAIAEEPKVCKHVHLPLQSGSDAVLARMRRGYDYAGFANIARALRAAMPEIAITTDLLVGFSGETDDDHRMTLAAMAELRFDGAFMFAYSERDGTHAARRLPDDIPDALKQARLTEAIKLQAGHARAAHERYIGRTARVLLHARARRSAEQLVGRLDDFKAVVIPRGELAPGMLVDVRIERATSATLTGSVVGA